MKKKVIVVDDDPDVAYTVESNLKQLDDNYDIIYLGSGQQCLDFLKENEAPDIILLDIMMPEMNGLETFEKLKENDLWKNIPVLFITASDDKLAEQAKQSLGENCLEKPYDPADLKRRIDKIIAQSSQ